jgi:hypothetical protein
MHQKSAAKRSHVNPAVPSDPEEPERSESGVRAEGIQKNVLCHATSRTSPQTASLMACHPELKRSKALELSALSSAQVRDLLRWRLLSRGA